MLSTKVPNVIKNANLVLLQTVCIYFFHLIVINFSPNFKILIYIHIGKARSTRKIKISRNRVNGCNRTKKQCYD